jgi:predicted TIM-barrel fold metal-dependent hydrolase
MEKHGIDKTALIASMVEPFSLREKSKQMANGLMRSALLRARPLGLMLYQSVLVKEGYFCFSALTRKYRIYDQPDNRAVAEAIERYPDRFLGWIFINPAVDEDAVAKIEEWSANPAMVGVKAHPFWHRYDVALLDPAAAWCREHGYPLLIHLGYKGGSGDYRRLPDKYPGLKVIYAHAGIPYYRALWAYIKDKKDAYVDLSSPYLDQKLVRMAVDFLGPDKCLYGTDGPYGEQSTGEDYDYGWIKGRIESLPLSDAEREKIFSGNFQTIAKH